VLIVLGLTELVITTVIVDHEAVKNVLIIFLSYVMWIKSEETIDFME
jgi:hypothetical protein